MLSISHTVFITGLIMPIKELSQLARDKGLLILADSAHGIGMLDLDMKALGIDFFASSPYKWLGAPTGVGLLYVRKEALDKVWSTVVSTGWESNAKASKLDPSGQRSDALLFALDEAFNFNNRIGRTRIERRIKVLSARLKQELAKVAGVKDHTPTDPYLSAGLTAFSMGGSLEPRSSNTSGRSTTWSSARPAIPRRGRTASASRRRSTSRPGRSTWSSRASGPSLAGGHPADRQR